MHPTAVHAPEIPVKLVSDTAVLRLEVERRLAEPRFQAPPPVPRQTRGTGILVTGATGLVGSAVVARLLADPAVPVVHCLVRAADPTAGLARLRAALTKRGAWHDAHAERLVVVCGDLAQQDLGLSADALTTLRAAIGAIVHSGAHLNFLATYRTLRAANVDAALALVDAFCVPTGAHLYHVSSIGVLTGAGFPDPAPEQHDYRGYQAELVGGYTQTKWVADAVLCALQARGFPISILRPAHVVDLDAPVAEPSPLVDFYRTQLRTGLVPHLPFRFYMTPLRAFADATVALLRAPAPPRCYHFVGAPLEHDQVLAQLAAHGVTGTPLPLEVWKQRVQAACLAHRWPFLALLPYVAAMTPSRLQLGLVQNVQARALGFAPAPGTAWDAATLVAHVLRAHRASDASANDASAHAPATATPTPAVRELPVSDEPCDLYDFAGMRRLAARYGGAFTLRHKQRDLVVVTDAAIARHVLVDHFLDYRKGQGMMGQFGELLGKGLFTHDGEAWARDRKLLAPLFQGRFTERFAERFERHADALLARLRPLAGQPLEVHPHVARYSLGLAADCFFSAADVDDFPFAAIDRLKHLVPEFRHDLRAVPRATFAEAQASYRAFRTYVHELVARRRALPGQHHDVFEALVADPAMTPELVFGQVSSLIAASYDTTNVSLTFLWQLLAQHPDEQEALHAELRAHGTRVPCQDLLKLRRLRAFLDETLRLHPPIWGIPRFAIAEHTVAGLRLPAQADYLIHTWLIHRSERYWHEPERFRPDRFLAGDEPRDAAAYHPFSLGKRTCLGMGFALHEMLHVAARLLAEFRLVATGAPFHAVPRYPVLDAAEPVHVILEAR